jgi:ribonuclease VapC
VIVVDTSAAVAILLKEDDADYFVEAIAADPAPAMSAATLVELNAVLLRRRGPDALEIVRRFIDAAGIEIAAFTETQAFIASAAYRRFAALNFGDCFAYALARERDAPLLFKGNDFRKTDILPA